MFMVNHLNGFGVGGGPVVPATITATANFPDSADASTYTFTSQSFGTAASNRYMVACFGMMSDTGGTTGSSVTIGGVSATQIMGVGAAGGSDSRAEMWIAAVPTGANGTVVINYTAGCLGCGLSLYAVYGTTSSAYHTANSSSTGSPSVNLNIPEGGVAIGYIFTGGAAINFSWSGLTEAHDGAVFGNQRHSGASDAFASAQSSYAISITPDSAPSHSRFIAASFGP